MTFAGTQQTTPAPTAKSLFEQISPTTLAASPYDFSKAATGFTPTAQTFTKPTLLSAEEAVKQQPVLVRYQPDIKYGGLQTYQGPLQTSPYKDEEPTAPTTTPGVPTTGVPAPVAATRTPLGYEYSPYVSLTPDQISGSGNRAQITDMFKGIVSQQQKDVENLRTEYNQAMAIGNMPLASQLKGILGVQEQELAAAKADQLNANKYFTGVGGAYETPETLRQRVLGEQFKALKLGDELAYRGVDLGGIQVAAGMKTDPFTAELTRQQNEATAAQNVYNRLSSAYGKDSQIAKDYLEQVVTPQQAEYKQMLALTTPARGAVAPTNIFSTITAGEAYKGFTAPKLNEIRNVVATENAYKPVITGFETNITNLTKARDQADALGLSGYSSRLNQLIDTENAKLEQARGERQSAIDKAQPDPMRDLILGKQMTAQKIEGFTGVDIGGVDFSKMQAAAFDPIIARQNKDVLAAQNTYNQLVSLYGANNDTTKAFLNDVLNPQKQELAQANAFKTAANTAIGAYNTGKGYGYLNPPNIAVSKATTDAAINKAYDDFIRNNYEKRISTLDAAKAKAEQAGLGQYGDYFNQLMDTQRSYIDRANQARDATFAKRDAATRAKGSPPEGEVADSRSRALLKKLSGGGEATTAPLQKFAHGGAVHRAEGSPVYGEIPDTGPITKDTRAAFKAKGPSASNVASESARLLRNLLGEGVSNIESGLRGSIAAIPGTFGDIESIFRESDKTRKLATTEEVLRDYMPGRLTKPTKEAAGFEEVGTYLPLPIPAGTVSKVAKGAKTGAKKALEELGPTAGSILERAVPKFNIVPEGPAAANMAQRTEQGKYFSGRLDNFVSEVRNPVTKQQFLGSLKGKFRDYEIGRAAQALADLDDAAKITPTDLASRIKAIATPDRYKTTFVEPKTSGLHNNYDNVYGATGQPVGVINLSYEPTKAALEAEEASEAARSAAAALGQGYGSTEKVQAITSFLETSEDLAKNPERRAQLITGVNNLTAQLSALEADALPALQGIQDIKFVDIPEYKDNYSKLMQERTKAIPFKWNTPEYNDAYKKINDQTTIEIKMMGLQRLRQENPLVNTMLNRMATQEFSPPYKSADDMLQEIATGRFSSDNEVLPYLQRLIRTELEDSSKAILVDNKALLDDVLKETQRYSTYKGSHTAVNPEKNAMGFSRYTEHQVNVPGMGKLDGIYVSELQSDMFRDIKKLGKKGGSAGKDKQELSSLFNSVKSRLDPLKSQIEDRFGSMDSFLFVLRGDLSNKANSAEFSDFLTELGQISKGKADQIATDTLKDVKRITKLQERLGLPGGQVKGTYDIEEPIANIETQPQVVQQLLAKNAIAGAMQMGKSFVAFPGVESKQAKLYEKLPNNLKAVVKDLGEGFITQPITIKDATGMERNHWAVIWDNNAAQRVLNNGIPFKKGGLVEKSAVNTRRYI